MGKVISFTEDGVPIRKAEQQVKLKPTIRPMRRSKDKPLEFRLPMNPDIVPTDDGAIVNGVYFDTSDVPGAVRKLKEEEEEEEEET